MALDLIQYALGAASGGLVGLSLGLFGGGGSILAVPLLVYVVGIADVHLALGTSALAVAASALSNLIPHARMHTVKWRCGLTYALAGVVGAFAGSSLGRLVDGEKLLFLFALVMVLAGAGMLRRRHAADNPAASCTLQNAPMTTGLGLATGAFSGFFGIGGGFLIVPGLVAATSMPMLNAIGTSLVAVTAFGTTTALTYAASGTVDWPLAAVFIAGGALGGLAGATLARRLAHSRGLLATLFAGLLFTVAAYMLWRNVSAFSA